MPAKAGIISCTCAGGCVSFVYECSYPAAIVFDHTHVISIGMVSDSCLLDGYLFLYFLLRPLLPF